jgi:ribonucleotide reductase alpha subunit
MEFSQFAEAIYKQKYSQTGKTGVKENWYEIAARVSVAVGLGTKLSQAETNALYDLICERKFMPGGRYLYAAGRPFHQTQNCLLLRAEDSREGWADLLHKSSMALMTGAGIGVDYSAIRPEGSLISRTGGKATGPLALMQMVNEAGRHIMQGGARRSAIWAGLSWKHPDIFKFIDMKNWSPEVRKLKEQDFNFPATMDGTNISVILDREFFDAYEAGDSHAREVYWRTVKNMLSMAEPGFSVDYDDPRESLRNAPVSGWTRVLTRLGYDYVYRLADRPVTIWTGKQWVDGVVFKRTKSDADVVRVSLTNGRSIVCDPEHPFMVKRYLGAGRDKKVEVVRVPAAELCADDKIASDLPQPAPEECQIGADYGLGFVFGDGSIRNYRGELSVHTETKRQAYIRACDVLDAKTVSSPDRAYFKCIYSDKESLLWHKLSAQFIAGWFDADGCWTRGLLRISNRDRDALHLLQESLDALGIKSVVRADGESNFKPGNRMYTLGVLSDSLLRFREMIPTVRIQIDLPKSYVPYRASEIRVVSVEALAEKEDVFCCDVGVEEHSFMAEGVLVSNCTEITSEDDSDICNLGSLNLARFETLEEFSVAVELATMFLLAGTLYSDVPYEKVDQVRSKNRRLGLGLLGVHEWLLKRGKSYGEDAELATWLEAYRTISEETAARVADAWGISRPVKTRAIAPTGTIGIVAETTTGCEPIFCVAYRRRYKGEDGVTTKFQYVVDPTAKRLIDAGIDPDSIEDAYTLAENVERRVAFQAWLQQYVDHAISSTINLPEWGSELNNEATVTQFGEMLLKYLPKLRGITCYPDGCRGGQPLTRVKYQTAVQHVGQVFVEGTDVCDISGKGGSCGS